MKKFSFRLERLLTLKQRREDQKRQALALARSRVALQSVQLTELERERVRQNTNERARLTGRLNVNLLRGFSRYYHRLKAERYAGERVKQSLDKDAAAKTEELVAASREKRTLENYRDKLKERHDRQEEKTEQAELDDLTSKRYIAARSR
ncbi:MAG: flagellar export protein FliJ [Candidatus Zixiibacteriota bacterium]